MIIFGSLINKNYAWELSLFHKYRHFDDGVDWFNFQILSDWYEGDHKPSFQIVFVILNFKLFEFEIHNIHHAPEETGKL